MNPIFGLAWYKKEDWNRLLEVSEDKSKIEETHDEWLKNAENAIKNFKKKGIKIEKVQIDLNELIRWCNERNLSLNGEARANFVTHKMQKEEGIKRIV